MMLQQLSGFNAIQYYTVSIFEMAGTTLNPKLCTIIVGILLTMAAIISTILMDLTGRRVLMIVSETFMALAMTVLGLFFYLKQTNYPDIVSIQWIPLTALLVFVGGYGIAMGPIPWLVMTEIIPNPVIGINLNIFTKSINMYSKTLTQFEYWISRYNIGSMHSSPLLVFLPSHQIFSAAYRNPRNILDILDFCLYLCCRYGLCNLRRSWNKAQVLRRNTVIFWSASIFFEYKSIA